MSVSEIRQGDTVISNGPVRRGEVGLALEVKDHFGDNVVDVLFLDDETISLPERELSGTCQFNYQREKARLGGKR